MDACKHKIQFVVTWRTCFKQLSTFLEEFSIRNEFTLRQGIEYGTTMSSFQHFSVLIDRDTNVPFFMNDSFINMGGSH